MAAMDEEKAGKQQEKAIVADVFFVLVSSTDPDSSGIHSQGPQGTDCFWSMFHFLPVTGTIGMAST